MNNVEVAVAKLTGIRKSVNDVTNEGSERGRLPIQNFTASMVQTYFAAAEKQLEVLRKELPSLFDDFGNINPPPRIVMTGEETNRYERSQVLRLLRDIDHILEVRANREHSMPVTAIPKAKRTVFISHGRSNDWREVQAYIEKDIGIPTIELAQEPNAGQTILGKLFDSSERCDSAVIIMTGDDVDSAGQFRARENVIHEIGFFQGKYGLSRICLLYEEGTNIPSNIHGLVYAAFPKGCVSASFGLLVRELNGMYR